MALPAVGEGNQDLSMVVGEIKDLVDGVVENLTAIIRSLFSKLIAAFTAISRSSVVI